MSKTEKEQFYDDVLTTAVEGGINYWAQVKTYDWSEDGETVATVRDAGFEDGEPGEWVVVDRAKLRHAVAVIMDKSSDLDLSDFHRGNIAQAYRENDAGYLDAFDADAVVQVAVLGNVIYG